MCFTFESRVAGIFLHPPVKTHMFNISQQFTFCLCIPYECKVADTVTLSPESFTRSSAIRSGVYVNVFESTEEASHFRVLCTSVLSTNRDHYLRDETVTLHSAFQLPVRAKKTPVALDSKVKHMFEKFKYNVKKLPLRRSQKWVEAPKYVFAILEEIWA